MARFNNSRSQRRCKKPDKKQIRKKQAVLVQRCVQLLNSNADQFRAKLSKPRTPPVIKPSDGSLKHFKPIKIEMVDESALRSATALLENKFSLEESDAPNEQKDS